MAVLFMTRLSGSFTFRLKETAQGRGGGKKSSLDPILWNLLGRWGIIEGEKKRKDILPRPPRL